jgi:iron(III) transport system permease protein
MGWLFLLDSRIGILNKLIASLAGTSQGPFNIASVVGMGWVLGLGMAAVVFMLSSASFAAMDPTLEEAASVYGARPGASLRHIFLPLMAPAIVASVLYVFTSSIAAFDVAAILGVPKRVYVFSTFVWAKSLVSDGSQLPQYGAAAAMGVLLISVALLTGYYYGKVIGKARRYQVITGKAYKPRRLALGPWVWPAWLFVATYMLLNTGLPLLAMIWAAALPYFEFPSIQALGRLSLGNFQSIPRSLVMTGVWHTATLLLVVPMVTLLLSFAFSWVVVRSRSRFRGLADFVAFLPHAVPDLVFALGALLAALFVLNFLPLNGSLAMLGILYVVTRLSFGTRLLNSSLIQIHQELEDAAAVCGATRLAVTRHIMVPLVTPALLVGWLWTALLTSRELTMATFLSSPQNVTLPVVLWSTWSANALGIAAAMGVLLVLCLVPLIALYWIMGRHYVSRVVGS